MDDGDFEVVVESDREFHEDHHVEVSETIIDNAVEYTVWGWCYTCDTDVRIRSVTIL